MRQECLLSEVDPLKSFAARQSMAALQRMATWQQWLQGTQLMVKLSVPPGP